MPGSAEQPTDAVDCTGVDLAEALLAHLDAIKTILEEKQATVEAKTEELMLQVVKEDANAAVVSHLLRALGERSEQDTAFAGRGLWLRVAVDILDRGAVGTMLITCLPAITEGLSSIIENLHLKLLAPSTQVRQKST